MVEVLEYIMENYTLLLGGAILILLAIIGSYADKTNFGQGKVESNDNASNPELPKKRINDYLQDLELGSEESQNEEAESLKSNEEEKTSEDDSKKVQDSNLDTNEIFKNDDVIAASTSEEIVDIKPNEQFDEKVKSDANFEDELNEFDKQLDELLPSKSVISDDLLSEIDDLSVNSSLSSISKNEIPDLDDIDLPKIKKMDEETKDIWKF